MTVPLEEITKFFRVRDSTGAAVASLVTASFTFTAWKKVIGASSATWSHSSAIVEVASGIYAWTFVAPPVGPVHWGIICDPVTATYQIEFLSVTGETENQDLDSVYANTTQLTGVISTTAVLGNQTSIQLVVYRYRTMSIVVRDQAGALADLSGYTNLRVGIRDKTQTAMKWAGSNGSPYNFAISADASGNLTLNWPESMFGPIYTTWVTLGVYTLGDFVVPTSLNGWIYQVTVAGTAAAGEPVWPTTEGGTVVSGTVTFTARKKSIWTATTAKSVGDTVTPTTPNGRCYRCTTAGTTGGSAPTFPTTVGGTVTDGTVVWTAQDDVWAFLTAGVDSLEVEWEVIGDSAGDTSKTVAIIRSSPCTLLRREEGS